MGVRIELVCEMCGRRSGSFRQPGVWNSRIWSLQESEQIIKRVYAVYHMQNIMIHDEFRWSIFGIRDFVAFLVGAHERLSLGDNRGVHFVSSLLFLRRQL